MLQAFACTIQKKSIDINFKRLIEEIEKRYHQFLNSSFETIRDEYIRTSNIWHRKLTFTENGEQFIGEAIDIDNDGF